MEKISIDSRGMDPISFVAVGLAISEALVRISRLKECKGCSFVPVDQWPWIRVAMRHGVEVGRVRLLATDDEVAVIYEPSSNRVGHLLN